LSWQYSNQSRLHALSVKSGPESLSLESLVEQFSGRDLPPVKQWHPENERDIDMRIDRAGDWYYNGSKIQRQRMVALFSSVLRREEEQYFLVTPGEKLRITVENVPFVALLLRVEGQGSEQQLIFTDNCGNQTTAGSENPVWMEAGDAEPLPYVMVRDNLPALIARPVYYQMADLLSEQHGAHGLWSSGHFFPLADSSDM